jgi:hypothetical protein
MAGEEEIELANEKIKELEQTLSRKTCPNCLN